MSINFFSSEFEKSLEEDLKGDTSGDVEKVLVELSKVCTGYALYAKPSFGLPVVYDKLLAINRRHILSRAEFLPPELQVYKRTLCR